MNTNICVTFPSDDLALIALRAVESDIVAMHNHIASAVENPEHWGGPARLKLMVTELRDKQACAKALRNAFFEKHGANYTFGSKR
jgi:hypothetical protein